MCVDDTRLLVTLQYIIVKKYRIKMTLTTTITTAANANTTTTTTTNANTTSNICLEDKFSDMPKVNFW